MADAQIAPDVGAFKHTPEPLTAPDCDLRDFPFMPLDVLRLRDSELAASEDAEAFRAAVMLWCASWHQVPAASLPDDDAALCRLAGYGRDRKTWARAKAAGAMRGYVLCDDGRLYHPVVAEKARDAWAAKIAQRQRTEAARIARAQSRDRERHTPHGDNPKVSVTENVATSVTDNATDNVTSSKGQGQGQGEGEGERPGEKKERPVASQPPSARAEAASFAEWWAEYPRKVGRGAASRAYATACKRASPADLLLGLRRQRWPDDPQFIPHAATWLNQARWLDDPGAAAPPPKPKPFRNGAFELAAQLMAEEGPGAFDDILRPAVAHG